MISTSSKSKLSFESPFRFGGYFFEVLEELFFSSNFCFHFRVTYTKKYPHVYSYNYPIERCLF